MSQAWRRGMPAESYDYDRRWGVHPVSWEEFHGLCKGLARAAATFAPQVVLPIGRGGSYAGMLIAHLLQLEAYHVRVSRRLRDVLTYSRPVWQQRPPGAVRGKRVLIVDEICVTGETLQMVRDKALAIGAAEVRTAVLYAHLRGEAIPDYIGFVSDELILNPWDRQVLRNGEYIFHPEYVEALRAQGREPDEALLIDAPEVVIAKG